jgi:hypothetical protein
MSYFSAVLCDVNILATFNTQNKQERSGVLTELFCFPDFTTHRGCIFHSPVAGFNLLVFEVS